jgi:RimJ/RimL family protein N-acetyltransferase
MGEAEFATGTKDSLLNTETDNLLDCRAANHHTRLVFEPLRQAHAFDLVSALTDPRVYQFIEGPFPTTAEQLAAQFAQFEMGPPVDRRHECWWDYVVRLGQSGPAIGRLEATLIDGWAEVAYLLGPEYWGHGYAAEALTWLHGQLWRDQTTADWWASVCPGNWRSMRLLTRLGYSEVQTGWPMLTSYDPGDRVFHRRAGATVQDQWASTRE